MTPIWILHMRLAKINSLRMCGVQKDAISNPFLWKNWFWSPNLLIRFSVAINWSFELLPMIWINPVKNPAKDSFFPNPGKVASQSPISNPYFREQETKNHFSRQLYSWERPKIIIHCLLFPHLSALASADQLIVASSAAAKSDQYIYNEVNQERWNDSARRMHMRASENAALRSHK